jgi:hypothetical protein
VCRVSFDAQVHAGAVADVLDGIAEQIADGVFQWSRLPRQRYTFHGLQATHEPHAGEMLDRQVP